MKCLLINTAVSVSTVVLIVDEQVIAVREEKNCNDLSAKIFFMIDEVFQVGNLTPNELNKIFVVAGPGSFTGIRIGLAIAKTMAWALKIDLIPISSLELLASSSNIYDIVPLIDARRGYVYAGVYDTDLNTIISDQYIELNQLQEKLSDNSKFNYVSYDEFENLNINYPEIDYLKIIKKHKLDYVENCHSVNPVYLKLTEAEEKRTQNEDKRSNS